MKKLNKKDGITLIALVVTIIVLIILAGVSINLVLGDNGIVTKAIEAKEQEEIAQITDKLELEKSEIYIDNKGTRVELDQYLEEIQKEGRVDFEITAIERVDEDNAYITVNDKYEFLLENEDNGNLKITYKGKVGKLAPRIVKLEVVTSTTDSITVKVEAKRAEKYNFYIKEHGNENEQYKLKDEGNETGEYIYSELTDGVTYDIKVEAINKNGIIKGEITGTTVKINANLVTYYIDTATSYQENVYKDQTCLEPTIFTPEKSGWTFVGWREDNEASETVLESKIMGTEPITLYAVFKQDVTVTYYNGTTTAAKSTGTRYYNNGNTIDPTFTIAQAAKSGWTTRGWSTATTGDAGVTYSSLSNTTITANTTLYGLYYKSVTLSYNGNGATSGSVATQSGTAYYNSSGNTINATFKISANGFARTNYGFSAWALGSASGTRYSAGANITLASSSTLYAIWFSSATNFDYTGGIQSYTVPATGTYKLEVWGAQGGTGRWEHGIVGTSAGGLGGYAYGNVNLTAGTVLYIGVGGKGSNYNVYTQLAIKEEESYTYYQKTINGGYNGGGTVTGWYGREAGPGAGGGATHIGTFNSTLAAHGNKTGLYIVAGGGGGAGQGDYDSDEDSYYAKPGGTGGGTTGGHNSNGVGGGTQSAGGGTGAGFGTGASTGTDRAGAGGGGYYGGGAGTTEIGGGGGSGYIGGVTSGSMQNGVRSGNGYARITYVGS